MNRARAEDHRPAPKASTSARFARRRTGHSWRSPYPTWRVGPCRAGLTSSSLSVGRVTLATPARYGPTLRRRDLTRPARAARPFDRSRARFYDRALDGPRLTEAATPAGYRPDRLLR